MQKIYQSALEEIRKGRPVAVKTSVNASGQGTVADFQRSIISGENRFVDAPQLLDVQAAGCEFHEPFYPPERLIILGGGHIAVPLVTITALTGFAVTIVDDRPGFADKSRFPDAVDTVCDSFTRYLQALELTPYDYVVVITRGHRHDHDCLREITQQPFPRYVGMIGSKRRVKALLRQLDEEGCDPDKLARINTPIGLNIGAVTPEEIAVSIAGELIQRRRERNEDSPSNGHTDVDVDLLSKLVQVQQPCSVVTVVSAKGSVPRGVGAKMLVYADGRIDGSIGGGCSEAEVVRMARDMIGTGRYRLHDIDMTGSVAEDEGMVCGGVMKVLIEDFVANAVDSIVIDCGILMDRV